MSTPTQTPPARAVEYPDSDGQPMSDNTLQFEWIVTIKEGLGALFADRPDVFVAGDLLWYPVEGDPKTRTAPDAMVAFGRPRGYRGSYKQWEEEGVAPQVVFEVLSPGNRSRELIRKFQFYERFGVEEYYLYDPDHNDLSAWRRVNDRLQEIDAVDGWTSPLLRVRFELTADTLRLIRPDGQPFLTYLELYQARESERQRAESERQRAERLAERLRALGIDPDTV
jgi:Uma2 family endonuclease